MIAPASSLVLDRLGSQIVQRSRELARDSRVLFSEGKDPRVLRAVRELADLECVTPVLFDDPDIDSAAFEAGIDISAIERLDHSTFSGMPDDSAWRLRCADVVHSAKAVKAGAVDSMVAGASHSSADVLRVAIKDLGAKNLGSPISESVLLDTSGSSRLGRDALLLADVVVSPQPSADQLADIAVSSVETWNLLGMGEPRVAFLSFSTLGSASTVETCKIREAQEIFARRMPAVLSDGELQLDSALDPGTAQLKGAMTLGGHANILIFPNLDAANIGFKMAQLVGGFNPYGVIQGVRSPCVDVSRRTSVEDLVVMAALSALSAVLESENSQEQAHDELDGGKQ